MSTLFVISYEEDIMSDTHAMSETPTAPRGRAMNITLWVVQALLALFFAFIGVLKLIGPQEVVDQFATIGLGQWFRYLTGAVELAGAIGLLIPRLAGLAALGLVGVMVGAVITHLTVLPPAINALFPALLGVVFVLIAWARWPQTKALLGKPKR
ncbi:MAG: DoxX family protein [Pseudonocardiaceae bacterium]